MAEATASHIRHLYKAILRLHRSLPTEMRILGNEYVREEFRRHKNANPENAVTFVREWTHYALQLSRQLGIKSLMTNELGTSLTRAQLDEFQPDQLHQLYELQQAAFKVYRKSHSSEVIE